MSLFRYTMLMAEMRVNAFWFCAGWHTRGRIPIEEQKKKDKREKHKRKT